MKRAIGIPAAAAAFFALAGAADARAAARPPALAPDVTVVSIAARGQPVAGMRSLVVVTLAERTGRADTRASVSVSGGTSTVTSTRVVVRAGRRVRFGVLVTPRTSGPVVLTARALAAGDRNPANDVAATTILPLDFSLAPGRVLVDGFGGFGAQFNHHVYSGLSRNAGVSEENIGDMEQKVTALGPQLVRLFFTRAAFADPDRMASFVRTAQLAQRTGATINVTWQTSFGSDPEVEMPMFADVLADLVRNRGVSNLRWVTLQNEVNRTRITMQTYDRMHRLVDARLTAAGVRDRIRFMVGDLVESKSPLGETQSDWLRFLGTRMNDLLDAYAIHVYWNFWHPAKIEKRLAGVRTVHATLPAAARKPLYVTEFGVRGRRVTGDGAGPGTWDDGTPLEATNISAFQHAWLKVLSARLGYAGAIKWDAYFGRYDSIPQSYHLIGPPQEGWPLRPGYHLARLFTSTTRAGWRTVGVDGGSGTRLTAAFAGGPGELTVVGLDTAGGLLNAPSAASTAYALGGLPPRTAFRLVVWNGDGSGTVADAPAVTTDAAGIARMTVPQHAVFALTTLPA